MIEASVRPRLASKAKLRLDKKTGQHVLIYPEKGMILNPTGAAIVGLCRGQLTMDEIVAKLREDFSAGPGEGLAQEVETFLRALADRGLIEGLPP